MVTLTLENQQISENCLAKQKIPKEICVISQEVQIAKNLSCCNLKLREKQLKKLKKWLQIRSASSFEYSLHDLLRIWKGLFYCFWMSDKPLIQEELAEEFGRFIECFKDTKTSLRFFDAFLQTMCAQWFGLDQWRLDKFLMLTRRMLRYTLLAIKKENWAEASIQDFNFYIAESVLDNDVTGMIMHLVEIFMEELAKTANGNITGEAVAEFTKPFIIYLAKQRDTKTLGDVRNKIFYHLLWQSELGRERQEKYEAWKEIGFPNINFTDLEKVNAEDSDTEVEEKSSGLDPRAGNIDVFIPILPVDIKMITDVFEKILENEIANAKSKKCILTILEKYKKFESGTFPLGIRKMPVAKLEPLKPLIQKTLTNLDKLDDELYGVDRNLKKLNKKKRRKLLTSLNVEEASDTNYDSIINQALLNYKPKKKIAKTDSLHVFKKRKVPNKWIEEDINVTKQSKQSNKQEMLKEKCKINKKASQKRENFIGITETVKSKLNVKDKTDNAKQNKSTELKTEWDKPLKDGEIEYFVSSTKIRLNEAKEESTKNIELDSTKKPSNIVFNPCSKLNNLKMKKTKTVLLGKKLKKEKSILNVSLPEKKRVKIALGKNMIQKPSEYIKQIKNSPQLPYDAAKKPAKSLLKPNQMPSPINPFYKKKIGLQLNDTY